MGGSYLIAVTGASASSGPSTVFWNHTLSNTYSAGTAIKFNGGFVALPFDFGFATYNGGTGPPPPGGGGCVKADVLIASGVTGEGVAMAPGLQKEFNPNSKACERAGKK